MKIKMTQILPSLTITLLILVVLEVFGTAFLPLIGLTGYKLGFNILIILFLGFRVETAYMAFLILIVQYFHSFFSVEGWAMGTFAGVIVCMVISYLRDLLHFSSATATILVTQIFQMVWFILVSSLIFLKLGSWTYVLDKLWRFVPESLLISALSPFFFTLMDRVWRVKEIGLAGGEET